MSTSPSPPSCCAGLRQTLLHGWQQDFPLHPSPFRQMAERSGATPRELLSLCVAMQRSGALQPIRVRWGAAMQRQRWRLAFAADPPGLAALPGCFRIERAATGTGLPATWAEFEAVDEAALDRQLVRLQQPPAMRLLLPAPDATLACADPRLAACVEQGLLLCSKPYAECAKRLGCSEQRVLASLGAWRRSGQLECLVLKPTPPAVAQPGLLALWRGLEAAPALLARLQACHGVDRVIAAPASAAWPWRLSLVLRGTPQLAAEHLRELLAEAGLTAPPNHCLPLRIEQPRDQAMLFNTDD